MPCWSTARHSQCAVPAILTTTSSRCHLSPARGSRRRISFREPLAKLQCPLPHRLVTDHDAAGGQHLLDHSQAQREAEIQPDRVADDLGWKAVTGVSVRSEHRHTGRIPATARHGNPALAKLTVPSQHANMPAVYHAAMLVAQHASMLDS